jgi:hypothetical protein
LQLLLMSLGHQTDLRQMWTGSYEIGNPRAFRTNTLDAIGPILGEQEWNWNFHQIVYENGTVYDACLALKHDLNGAIWQKPITGWEEYSYWQTGQYGLVKGFFDNFPYSPMSMVSQQAVVGSVFYPTYTKVMLQGVK